MPRQSRSHLEQKAGVTEQDLIGAAKGIIRSYLKGERERLSAEPLISEFVRVTSEEHPNPKRMGCPANTLHTQMVSSQGTDETILKHLEECGPCLRDYVEFLDVACRQNK